MQTMMVCVLMLLALPATVLAGEATVRETMLEIPTYALGPEDKNPPLWNSSVYPYPMQTSITGEKSVQKHRAVILENDFIRVIVLPDLGGRIYAAHDKTNHDFDFIYHNHVIKPGLVAMRGAWLSGGIEWNFPTRGHSANTVSPVEYRIVRDKGGVTCIVGTGEWVRRMRWSVAITVPADRSQFFYRVRLVNPTLTHNNAYFWANAAVHAWDDTRVTFPPAEYTFAGMRRNPQPWPIANGKDVSWYKNTPNPYDYFCGTSGDYQAAYNYDRDNGSVCCANRYESMGRKFWTWGTARGGMIWEDILTDSDGQYIEVQSGRLLTQGDTWIFEPHMLETWEETWYPVKGMKGLAKANGDAAVNLAVADGKALAAVNTTKAIAGATIRLIAGGKTIFEEKADLAAGGSWKREVAIAGKADGLKLVVLDAQGAEVISYEPNRREQIPPPELEPAFPADGQCTAEQLYLKGYYAQKHWQPEAAVALFEKAIKADPGLTGALRELAIHYYKTGQYERARQCADRVLQRNDDDLTARYYRALAKIKLGIDERTEEDFQLIGRRAAYRHVAPYLLAALAVKRGELAEAEKLLAAASLQEGTSRALVLRAAVLRRLGQRDQAAQLVAQAVKSDPLDNLAIVEKALQGDPVGLDTLRDDPQEYLEAACAYQEMNLWDDAAAVLQVYERREGAANQPFIFFYLGYYAHRGNRPEVAKGYYQRGLALSADYVFPSRAEDFAVLDAGLRYAPDEWKLHYYRGLLLCGMMRWEEGLNELQLAERSSPSYAVLYWCLGEIYREKLHDLTKAQAAYERALACDAKDAHYYIVLDQIYAERGVNDKRDAMYKAAPPTVLRDYRVLLRKAMWLVDAGRCDEALAILRSTRFHPWEGWSGAHDVYVKALRQRAGEQMKQRRFEQAIEDLRQAMEYPENLGSGRPESPDFSYESYQIGLCCKSMGKMDAAREWFGKVQRSPWKEKAAEELRQKH